MKIDRDLMKSFLISFLPSYLLVCIEEIVKMPLSKELRETMYSEISNSLKTTNDLDVVLDDLVMKTALLEIKDINNREKLILDPLSRN